MQCGRVDVIDGLTVGPCVLPKHANIERHQDEDRTTWPDQDRIEMLTALGQKVDNSLGKNVPYVPES